MYRTVPNILSLVNNWNKTGCHYAWGRGEDKDTKIRRDERRMKRWGVKKEIVQEGKRGRGDSRGMTKR